jgi:hypothetical protein
MVTDAPVIFRPLPIEFNADRAELGIRVPGRHNNVQLDTISSNFLPQVSGLRHDIQVDVPPTIFALILANVDAVKMPSDTGCQI